VNTPHRIKNQSLSKLLRLVVQLGGTKISSHVFVEASRECGFTIGDAYFLHFDTLFDYGFLRFDPDLVKSESARYREEFYRVSIDQQTDLQFSLTHTGQEFLHRYGVG